MNVSVQSWRRVARRVAAVAAVGSAVLTAVTVVTSPAVAAPRPPFYTADYTWTQDHPAVRLKPTGSYVCVLTRVGGHLQGGGEWVRVFQSGGWWYLGGNSEQDGVNGAARCFLQKDFGSASGITHWLSADEHTATGTGDDCSYTSANTWWGDAATIMSGIGGNYAGGAEAATVTQSLNGRQPSQIATGGCQDDSQYQMWSYSYFVGKPHAGNLAKFMSPDNPKVVQQAGTAGEIPESHIQGNDESHIHTVVMSTNQDAMCYFTDIRGKFRSAGDYVSIDEDASDWALTVHSSTRDGISVKARCYATSQN